MNKVIPAAIALIAFLVLSFLPLIPVESAAVTAPIVVPGTGEGIDSRVYRSNLVSLQDLFGLGMLRVGVTYRLSWYSLPAMLAVLGMSGAAGWASRRFSRRVS